MITLLTAQTLGLFPPTFPVPEISQAFHSSPGGWGQGSRQESFLFSSDKSFIREGVDLTSVSRFLTLLEGQWES